MLKKKFLYKITFKIHFPNENILHNIFAKECKSLMNHPHQLMEVMSLKFLIYQITVTFEILL